MSKFTIEIASVPDRDNLVAEIWYEKYLIAEINREEEIFKIELYNNEKLVFQFDDFLNTLEQAKHKLLE